MYSKSEMATLMQCAREVYTEDYFVRFEKLPEFDKRLYLSRAYGRSKLDSYMPAFNLLKHDPHIGIRVNIAEHDITSFEILSHLSNDENYQVREAVARNNYAPSEILLLLSRSPEKRVKWAVAKNKNTCPLALENLGQGEIDDVLARKLAQNMKTPFDILRKIAALDDEPIKTRLCKNLITPPDILFGIAKSASNRIKNRLVKRSWLPEELLKSFSYDPDRRIRQNVARNKSLTEAVAEILSNDECEYVRAAVAASGLLSESSLEKLTNDQSVHVRGSIAMSTPVEQFRLKLLNDRYNHVRDRLAYNRHVSTSTLRQLLNDPSKSVRYSATCNIHKVPEDQWDNLLKLKTSFDNSEHKSRIESYKTSRGKRAAIDKLHELLGGKVKFHTIENTFPNINPEWFPFIHADGEAENIILKELCLNPSTPKELLELYFKTYPEYKGYVYSTPYYITGKTHKALHAMALYCTDDNVLGGLSANRSCNSETLDIVAEKGNNRARANVASHDATSLKTLEKLAKSSDVIIKFNIIRRHEIPPSIRHILENDPVMSEILEARLKGAYYIPGYNLGFNFNRLEAQKMSSKPNFE